jgi:hypothetical protein
MLRACVHAPTKSVSALAAISVVLIFHVIFMARRCTGPTGQTYQDDHQRVGVMPATHSINNAELCVEQVRTHLPCDQAHGSHVDCSASMTKFAALQAPIAILSVCVYTRPGLYCGNNDVGAGTDTDFVGACTPALRVCKLRFP